MRPLVRFRIYPPKCGGFWEVWIFRTANDLRAFYGSKAIPGSPAKDTTGVLAFARALIQRGRDGKYRPSRRGRRGMVAMCLSACGVGVASHEWTHAAFYEMTSHAGRKSLPLVDDEKFAMLQGEMVRRFWLGFMRRFRQHGRRWVRR